MRLLLSKENILILKDLHYLSPKLFLQSLSDIINNKRTGSNEDLAQLLTSRLSSGNSLFNPVVVNPFSMAVFA